jgi:hypothetical protein
MSDTTNLVESGLSAVEATSSAVRDTFNPILGEEKFLFWHRLSPQLAPRSGVALVFGDGGARPAVLWPDDTREILAVRWGSYRRIYQVDISAHSFGFDCRLPRSNDAFDFYADVHVTCRVEDPALIIQRHITDARAALEMPLIRVMRSVSRRYNLSRMVDAEKAIAEAIEKKAGCNGFEVENLIVRLATEEEERAYIRKLWQIECNARIEEKEAEFWDLRDKLAIKRKKMYVNFYNDLIQKGRGQLVILYLVLHPEEIERAVELLSHQRTSEREQWWKELNELKKLDAFDAPQLQELVNYVLQRLMEEEKQQLMPDSSDHPVKEEPGPELQERQIGA